MLGVKRRYIAVLGLSALGWAASHFVSISGLENVRLVSKSEALHQKSSGRGDSLQQGHLSDQTTNIGWTSIGSFFSNSNRSTSSPFDSYRVSPNKIRDIDRGNLFQTSSHSASGDSVLTFDSMSNSEPGKAANPAIPRIRIASFNLHAFNEHKLQKLPVTETLVRIIRQFDVVAVQHISSRQTDLLPLLIERVNRSDRKYDYLIGPYVGREQKQQFAFLFDTERVETDRGQLYTVDDPQDLLTYEPLVGWFRTTLPQRSQSFTFSLVNLRFNPLDGETELRLLPDLIRSVRNDGRIEDDIVLVGEFMASSDRLAKIPGLDMLIAIDGVPTTIGGDAMTGNILFPTRATDEFTGKSGAIDFLRQLNLSFDQAAQVSSNLPIWAEFTAYEGGKP